VKALAASVALVLLLGSCGDAADTSDGADGSGEDENVLNAEVASYDLAVGDDERLLVGAFGSGLTFLSYGTVDLELSRDGAAIATYEAGFVPVPGQMPPSGEPPDVPTLTRPSEGRGVYEAVGVALDTPGIWDVTLRAEVDGELREATTVFEVAAEHSVVTAGELTPRTVNPLPGESEVPAAAVDSRSGADGTVPDPLLHEETIAHFIDVGEPLLVVVSTPVFCVSRFCGPITDLIEELAADNSEDLGFVHLEVWEDFASTTLNESAVDWIWPGQQGDPAEPWVFLVGADGRLVRRWDNVVAAAELESEIAAITDS
jgi:hypothetical protein